MSTSSVTDHALRFLRPEAAQCSIQNVGSTERVISAVGGAAITYFGLSRGGFAGVVIAGIGGALLYRGFSGNCQMYEAVGVNTNERNACTSNTAVTAQYGCKYEKSFVINRPAQELYDHWRKLENLPSIMRHLESVTQLTQTRTRWVAAGPMGMQVEWDAEVINEDSGRMIAWRSLPGAQVDTAGSVHFTELPASRGTEVRVSLKYNPPGGKIAAGIAWLIGSGVEQEIDEDMREFKQAMEAGARSVTSAQTTAAV